MVRTRDYRVDEGERVDLKRRPTRVKPLCDSKEAYEAERAKHVAKLAALERVHYADGRHALLVIFQGMDTAGKDSAIRHVMSGVDPRGTNVTSFQQPSTIERKHDFLWRTVLELPQRGRIAIFNRSYYEEVLIVRVHPELLEADGFPADERGKGSIWRERYESIVDHERHLHRNGTRVVKVFLHISKEEQRKRLLNRIDDPTKNWKFSREDVIERRFWSDYRRAYEKCLSATSRRRAPWYVVPADDKDNARLIVSKIVLEALADLEPRYPKLSPARRRHLQEYRRMLEKDKS
jgi:PPK2 family polyphosphate:nucleotide phosphotransferase